MPPRRSSRAKPQPATPPKSMAKKEPALEGAAKTEGGKAMPPAGSTTGGSKRKVKEEEVIDEDHSLPATPKKPKPSKSVKKEEEEEPEAKDTAGGDDSREEQKPRKARGKKAKAVIEEEGAEENFPERVRSEHWIGAHISMAGGIEKAITNARKIGGNAFALFVRPKMQWASKPIPEENVAEFKRRVKDHGYTDRVMPHGCYLINLANPDQDKRDKAMEAFLDDVQRCALLGVGLYNFHPGSSVGGWTMEEACESIARCINRAHNEVEGCPVILLENMAGTGNTVGGKLEELALVIKHVVDKSRVGVCIDTCHAFAAGYELRTRQAWEAFVNDLERTVGLSKVLGWHLNDSKQGLGEHKDRHANLGCGQLGLMPFYYLVNDDRFRRMPLVLETPAGGGGGAEAESEMNEVWSREIELLYSMQGLDEAQKDAGWIKVRRLLDDVKDIRKRQEAGKAAKGKDKKESQAVKTKRLAEEKAAARKAGGAPKKGAKARAKKEEAPDEQVDSDDNDDDEGSEQEYKPKPTKSRGRGGRK